MWISVLCSSREHPVFPRLEDWCREKGESGKVELVTSIQGLTGGDILFLIGCHEIVSAATREQYRASLVVHGSDVPKGRGWSPLVWQILEGRNNITVSLLEAVDGVDSGPVWKQEELLFEGHELYDEINHVLFDAVLALMDFAIENLDCIKPVPQGNAEPSYYRRRTPEDSRIDPEKSIAEQFDLLRIADSERYPAFFDYRGHRYEIRLVKSGGRN